MSKQGIMLLLNDCINNVRTNNNTVLADVEVRDGSSTVFSMPNSNIYLYDSSFQDSGIYDLNDVNISLPKVLVMRFSGYNITKIIDVMNLFSTGKNFSQLRVREKIMQGGQAVSSRECVFDQSVEIVAVQYCDDLVGFCFAASMVISANIAPNEVKEGSQVIKTSVTNAVQMLNSDQWAIPKSEMRRRIMESGVKRALASDAEGAKGHLSLLFQLQGDSSPTTMSKCISGFSWCAMTSYGFGGEFENINIPFAFIYLGANDPKANLLKDAYSSRKVCGFAIQGNVNINGDAVPVLNLKLENCEFIGLELVNNSKFVTLILKPSSIAIEMKEVDSKKSVSGTRSCIIKETSEKTFGGS